VTPLRAAGARQPERERWPTGREASGAADRWEAEAARLGAQGIDARQRRPRPARAVIRRARSPHAKSWQACRTMHAEVERGVGDETGQQTHSHARHCTPDVRARKANAQRTSARRHQRPIQPLDLGSAAVQRKPIGTLAGPCRECGKAGAIAGQGAEGSAEPIRS
jgi:hypothetical protein